VLIWVAEAAIIILISTLMSYAYLPELPFCETHECWLDEEKKIENLDAFVLPAQIDALKAGIITPIKQATLRILKSGRFSRLTIRYSKKCEDYCSLSVENISVSSGKNGKLSENTETIITNLILQKTMLNYLITDEVGTQNIHNSDGGFLKKIQREINNHISSVIWVILSVFVLLMLIVSIFDKFTNVKESNSPDFTALTPTIFSGDSTDASASATSPPTLMESSKLTKQEAYERIFMGMSYFEVRNIFGNEGVERSRNGSGEYQTICYLFYCSDGEIICVFLNDKLGNKTML